MKTNARSASLFLHIQKSGFLITRLILFLSRETFIALSLGSIELDGIRSELLYKGIILLSMYRQLTIWESRPDPVMTITVL